MRFQTSGPWQFAYKQWVQFQRQCACWWRQVLRWKRREKDFSLFSGVKHSVWTLGEFSVAGWLCSWVGEMIFAVELEKWLQLSWRNDFSGAGEICLAALKLAVLTSCWPSLFSYFPPSFLVLFLFLDVHYLWSFSMRRSHFSTCLFTFCVSTSVLFFDFFLILPFFFLCGFSSHLSLPHTHSWSHMHARVRVHVCTHTNMHTRTRIWGFSCQAVVEFRKINSPTFLFPSLGSCQVWRRPS